MENPFVAWRPELGSNQQPFPYQGPLSLGVPGRWLHVHHDDCAGEVNNRASVVAVMNFNQTRHVHLTPVHDFHVRTGGHVSVVRIANHAVLTDNLPGGSFAYHDDGVLRDEGLEVAKLIEVAVI